MDKTALINRVFEKTNIKIDGDDAVFVLAAMNETILETALAEGVQAMKIAVSEILSDQAIRLNQLRTVAANVSDNIEAGIVEGAATALVEVREVIDKLAEQASRYEAQSAEIEKGLSQLVSGFQKELHGVMMREVLEYDSVMKRSTSSFRSEIVDNQTRALDAIAKAKNNQTWGAVWQLAFALVIAVIGGVIASTIQLASVKDGIASIQTDIQHAKYPPMEGVTMEGLTSRKTQ